MTNKLQSITRLLLGFIYAFFGSNGFFHFLPMPPTMPEATLKFFEGMMSTGYFLPVLAGTEVLGGLLLLTGIASPLGVILLAPITIQILLFHIFLTPGAQNLGLPAVMVILHLLAIKEYWPIYRPLFAKKPIL